MGWTFVPMPYEGAKTYLDKTFSWKNDKSTHRVLDSAIVGRTQYYAAVERLLLDGSRSVFAVICLLEFAPKAADDCQFGYKEMDETMGGVIAHCPPRILDKLSDTDNEDAQNWREKCRALAEKKVPQVGDTIKMAHELTFSGDFTDDTFKVVRSGARGKAYVSQRHGFRCRIPNIKHHEYSIVDG